ncbi:MAG TPA: ABC transporter permease [Methanospirillum sp.]|uniref:ABC transporter permease n=1 Tax=Methanospirillum sp. TaxID=45200 RepID=UPI002B9618FC|nr:ABC transporter permease [Methanospirillum sp.]HWQ63036.1 ABC transporter permease [Methanospirillum sp.]
MRTYILIRLLQTIPVLIGITFIAFIFMYLAPGDPAEITLRAQMDTDNPPTEAIIEMQKEMRLDQPWYIQYIAWLDRVVHGDLGYSYQTRRTTVDEIKRAFPVTFILSTITIIISCIIAIPIGIAAGLRPNGFVDHLSRVLSILGLSIPDFFLGILGMLFFSIYLKILPVAGYKGPQYLILPAICLSAGLFAITMRLMRTSTAEVLEEEYIRTAVSKGLDKKTIIARHTLKNSIIPVITYIGTQYGWLFGSAMIVETLFALPGMGRLFVEAASTRDFMVMQGCILVFALIFVFINLCIDFSYYFLDPRVREENDF